VNLIGSAAVSIVGKVLPSWLDDMPVSNGV
jgi:hypothetical protein